MKQDLEALEAAAMEAQATMEDVATCKPAEGARSYSAARADLIAARTRCAALLESNGAGKWGKPIRDVETRLIKVQKAEKHLSAACEAYATALRAAETDGADAMLLAVSEAVTMRPADEEVPLFQMELS